MSPSEIQFHPALSLLYATSIYAFMLLLSMFLQRYQFVASSLTNSSGRYGSLDGLRGLLATGVLISHSITAYVYFTEGVWQWTASPLLNHLGQTSVALFFMITAFLFTNKAFKPTVRWKELYVSRVYRLGPLYAVIVIILFGLVFLLSEGNLKEPPRQILKEFLLWITFCCFGRPNINAYPRTWTMIAGVNWTLKLEILFYVAAVPALHLISRRLSIRATLISATVLLGALLLYREINASGGKFALLTLYAAHFLGGIIVALAFKSPRLKAAFEGTPFQCVAVAAMTPMLFMVHSHSFIVVVCTIVIFAAVVGGASLCGILNTKSAIWLGDISYGIYLIHGMVVWLTLWALKYSGRIDEIGIFSYWLTVLLMSAAVVLLASLSYSMMEKPIMARLSIKESR